MSHDASIEISVEHLLELRHIPTPSAASKPASNDAWLGAFASNKRGHGTDYDDLRLYSPGDDIRHIDWRASARTHELHTRLYREEKEHRTSVICDLRHCMFTGSRVLRSNKAVILSARLLWQACRGGTRVTLIVINPTGVVMVAPGTGHLTAIRGCNLLASEHQRIAHDLQRQNSDQRKPPGSPENAFAEQSSVPSNTDKPDNLHQHTPLVIENTAYGPTLDSVLQWLMTHREHKTTQLWLSGFDYEGEQFFNSLGTINRQSVNIAIHIDEPVLSKALPAGEFHFSAPDVKNNRDLSRHHSRRVHAHNRNKLEDTLVQTKQTRAAQFDALMIPYLDTAQGDDEVIAALRHRAYLA